MRHLARFIENVWINNLCCSCGTCAGICPSNAINLRRDFRGIYYPVLDNALCTKCGLCIKTCPGHEINLRSLNRLIFSGEIDDTILGNYISIYTGFSTDTKIRFHATSGGLITSLLIYGLEVGLIDGAIVTIMSKKNPLEPEIILAKSKEEIVSACGSKYLPVPVNIGIKKLYKERGKFAVVGLPCHIHGIRKAEIIDRKLREKIALHFGLFCSHTANFLGTEFILQKLAKIRQDDVIKVKYRGEGWPGGLTITMKTGHELFIPLDSYWKPIFGSFFFTPFRCLLCPDQTNELSDISFADAWLEEFKYDKLGTSLVISRSNIGEKLLHDAMRDGKIILRNASRREVVKSQYGPLYFKKKGLSSRRTLAKLFMRSVPRIDAEYTKPSILDLLGALFPFINIYTSSNSLLRKLLKKTPVSLLSLYGSLIRTTYSIAAILHKSERAGFV